MSSLISDILLLLQFFAPSSVCVIFLRSLPYTLGIFYRVVLKFAPILYDGYRRWNRWLWAANNMTTTWNNKKRFHR